MSEKYLHQKLTRLRLTFPNVPIKALQAALIEGIEAFSWMKDGTIYVGTCGTEYKNAVKEIMEYKE